MIPPRVDIHSLIVFYFVASEESVSSAAKKLFLTQPTVTYHIKALEDNIGLKLLDIRRQRVYLTQAGSGLFQYAKAIYQKVTDAENYLFTMKESCLRVGIAEIYSHIIGSVSTAFVTQCPDTKLIVRDELSLEVVEDVLNSQVDIGLVIKMEYNNPKLKAVEISPQEKIVVVASPDTICNKKKIELTDLYNYPLVTGPEKSAIRRLIIKKFEDEGLKVPPTIIAEVNNVEWGINLVENGKGVGLYPLRVVEKKISERRLKVLPLINDLVVGVDALIRSDVPLHPLAEKFISLVKENFK